ncbi:restriction endonuclease subunit S [Paenibacillus sp.]|uniref:restriction endonuclease subunit S n=1 Tax=Paenibacillus sp. TaxID=58172 RepID=UPI002D6AED18|nr:restriction endonuclease subunit S [Paenibacillus sp.]HZG87114.1 restriction endonuclease subunit S [Paenibacillus sp.]
MSVRTEAGLRLLAAAAHMQWRVADILEAKATEMETLRDWVLHTAHPKLAEESDADRIVMESCAFHHQMIELLQGMTKFESGLATHLRLLLEEEDAVDPFSGSGLLGGGDGA